MLKKLLVAVAIVVLLYVVFHHRESADYAPEANERGAASSIADETDCTGDCSGHQAGYDWAEEKGISDEDDCDAAGERSNSPSFAEGCKAFVNGDDPSDGDDKEAGDRDDD